MPWSRIFTTLMTSSQELVARRLRSLRAAFSFAWLGIAAGTYRIADGRGGGGSRDNSVSRRSIAGPTMRISIRRGVCYGPSRQKYGRKLSWADLHDSHGQRRARFDGASKRSASAAAVPDVWEPEEDVYWGPETGWIERRALQPAIVRIARAARRRSDGAHLRKSARTERKSRSGSAAAFDIRETFARMAMNDEETVALIAGGHTFGKDAWSRTRYVSSVASPKAPRSRSKASAGPATYGKGNADDTRLRAASRVRGRPKPAKWDNNYLDNLFTAMSGNSRRARAARTSVEAERSVSRPSIAFPTRMTPRNVTPRRCSRRTSR